jgi:hypothetical protein
MISDRARDACLVYLAHYVGTFPTAEANMNSELGFAYEFLPWDSD